MLNTPNEVLRRAVADALERAATRDRFIMSMWSCDRLDTKTIAQCLGERESFIANRLAKLRDRAHA